MSILIINNYFNPQDVVKINRIENALKKAGSYKIVIWEYSEIKERNKPVDLECVILSGSSAHLSDSDDYKKYEDEIEFVKTLDAPGLGICFGHQLIGIAFGSKLHSLPSFIKDFTPIKILETNDIFYTRARSSSTSNATQCMKP